MSDTGLSFMKAIGIRVHTVRYQKVRKKALLRRDSRDGNEDEGDPVTSKEYKRIRGTCVLIQLRTFLFLAENV